MSRLPARVLLPGGERPALSEVGAETGTVACVPLALAHPSARGFGVDVGRKQRKKKWRSRGVCQGEEGSCGAELVLKAGAGKNIARTLREEKSDIGKPIVRAWGKHRGPNRRRFCRQREKSLRVALCAVFGAG